MECVQGRAVWSVYRDWLCGVCTRTGGVECEQGLTVWSVYKDWRCGVCTRTGGVECVRGLAVWSVYVVAAWCVTPVVGCLSACCVFNSTGEHRDVWCNHAQYGH